MKDRSHLIQEDYINSAEYPWKVLVVCQCLNQATWMVAERVLVELFAKYPSPDSLDLVPLTYVEGNALTEDLYWIFRPLGFGMRRVNSLLDMSREYVQERQVKGEAFETYDIGSFTGCGDYACDAWTLFVLKQPRKPRDKQLARYAKRAGLYAEISGG